MEEKHAEIEEKKQREIYAHKEIRESLREDKRIEFLGHLYLELQ